ncbi:MAG TPA: cytochrome P450 [Acidimicrobiales bacterium]|nr:cytochrome P450 [Acidimicrobiales bacterium]
MSATGTGHDTEGGTGRDTDPVAPVHYSPYDYEIHEDPYPTYARLRTEAPLYRNDEFDFWALSRHADVQAAFRDPGHLSNRFGVTLDPAAYGPQAHKSMSFLAMDPPRHTRMRSLVSKAFTPRRVAELEPQIRALAVRYLDPAVEAGTFDMVGDVAGKLPMDVISQMIGVPEADRAEVRRLADLLVHREEGVFDVPQEGMEAALVLAGYFSDMVVERRRARRDDLTSGLLDVDVDDDRLTDDEIIAFLFLIVVAGNETTTKLLANAWYWAWRFPDQKAKALTVAGRAAPWVEETLRYDTSSQMLLRVTTGDVELLGTVIPDAARVLLLVGSANRDPDAFEHPDRYDLDRDTTKLISFGGGRHFCLGAPLARLEARVMLEELVARVADYDIDADGARRVHSINVRGFASLPTTVTTRAATRSGSRRAPD